MTRGSSNDIIPQKLGSIGRPNIVFLKVSQKTKRMSMPFRLPGTSKSIMKQKLDEYTGTQFSYQIEDTKYSLLYIVDKGESQINFYQIQQSAQSFLTFTLQNQKFKEPHKSLRFMPKCVLMI
eukprot:403362214